jgi:GNAT superfamily N-acetyltransferase
MSSVGLVRAVSEDDAEAVLELATVCDIAEIGEPASSIEAVRADFATPNLDHVAIDDPRGGLIGYAWVERPPGFRTIYGDVLVRPGAGAEVGTVLRDWVCGRARELGEGLPLWLFTDSGNIAKRQMYEAVGGRVIRRFYRMALRLDGPPPQPELPPRADISTVTADDDGLRVMHGIVDVAFLDHFGHEQEPFEEFRRCTADGRCQDLSLWWIARVEGRPAAGLYACALPAAGHIDTLGTLREYRGLGLARALLLTAFGELYRRGYRKVTLGVDATNPTGALALYESVGMHAEHEGWRYEVAPGAVGVSGPSPAGSARSRSNAV